MEGQTTPSVSVKTVNIGGGILADVYGLEQLPKSCSSVACIWLLHGRTKTKDQMKHLASSCLMDWQKRQVSDSTIGLIGVAFDQRNHGTRLAYQPANNTWREGNETHAQDMFSVYNGTAIDTSLLIDHLGSYLFQESNAPTIDQHLTIGYSVGGHAAWQLFFNEPRMTTTVVIVGCPDYARIMSDRARLSKRKTFTASSGAGFFGSKDFPTALISSVEKWDPKGVLFGSSDVELHPSQSEQKRLRELLDAKIKRKRILLCTGGMDKLIPRHCSQPFVDFLKNAVTDWYQDGEVYIEDIIYPEAGHECTEAMVKDITRFISDTLAGSGIERKLAPKI